MSGVAPNTYAEDTNATAQGGFATGGTSYPTAPTGTYLAPGVSGEFAARFYASTSTSEGRTAIVSPFRAEMEGATTATIGVTDVTNQQYFTNIDAVFNVNLSEAQSVQLLNSFKIEDTNYDLGEGLVEGSIVNGVYSVPATLQDTPNFTVDLDSVESFKEVLRSVVLTQANQISGKLLPNAKNYFEEEMRVEMNLQLRNSGLLDMLEASNLTNVLVSLDVSGGAASMASAIGAADAEGSTVIADKRRQFLTQIPLATLQEYLAEVQPSLHYLPLAGADSITFVFDVTVDAPAELNVSVKNTYDGAPGAYNLPPINFSSESRRIAFVCDLTRNATPFARDFAAASTPASVAGFDGLSSSAKLVEAKKIVKGYTTGLVALSGDGSAYLGAYSDVASPASYADYIQKAKYELAVADKERRLASAAVSSFSSFVAQGLSA
jgi:hypothetical protein